jgi:hypothetical protein
MCTTTVTALFTAALQSVAERVRTVSARGASPREPITRRSIPRRIRLTVFKTARAERAGRGANAPAANALVTNVRRVAARRANARLVSAQMAAAETDAAERVRAVIANVETAAPTAPTGSARLGIAVRSIRRADRRCGFTIGQTTVRARKLCIARTTRRSGLRTGGVTTGTNRFLAARAGAIRES